MMTGESDVHRIMPPMGGILPLAGAGIFALSQKDKDKKTPQKKEGPNYPEPKPPFKIFDSIVDFILANRRQPKPREELRLKEMLKVAAKKKQKELHPFSMKIYTELIPNDLLKVLKKLLKNFWKIKLQSMIKLPT